MDFLLAPPAATSPRALPTSKLEIHLWMAPTWLPTISPPQEHVSNHVGYFKDTFMATISPPTYTLLKNVA